MVCYSVKGNTFVFSLVLREPYTTHSEKQKALPLLPN